MTITGANPTTQFFGAEKAGAQIQLFNSLGQKRQHQQL